jgi:biopolymer transport protein TolQ
LNQVDLIEVLRQTTPVTWFVLGILLIVSVWSWGIILSKTLLLRKINRESETFWKMFRRGKSLSEIGTALETLHFTPLVPVFNAAAEKSGVASPRVLQRVVQHAAAAQLTRLEKRLNFLATTASVAPFIGLFGTVWGVMTSFAGLANVSVASLKTVAPGIADALIATGFGLFVAIPAVVAYNHFVYQIRNIAGQMDELQVELLEAVEEGTTV